MYSFASRPEIAFVFSVHMVSRVNILALPLTTMGFRNTRSDVVFSLLLFSHVRVLRSLALNHLEQSWGA